MDTTGQKLAYVYFEDEAGGDFGCLEPELFTGAHNAAPIRWGGSVQLGRSAANYAFFSFNFGFSAADSCPMR